MSTEKKQNKDYIETALSLLRELEGERIAGTETEERAVLVFRKYLEKIGVSFKKEEFELYISTGLRGKIRAGDKEMEIRPFGLSVPYEIEGTLLYFDHPEEALSVKNNLEDSICMFAVSPKYGHTVSLKKRGCRGFIVVQLPDKELPSLHLRQKAIKENNVLPACSIKYDDAVYLLNFVGKTVVMKGEGKTFKTKGHNIEVSIHGIADTEETILITGHYDTVPYSPGFSDNGAGVATMFALLKYFKDHPVCRNLRFVFFSGEEWGLTGSLAYAEKHADFIKNVVMGLNLDVGGDPIGILTGRVTGSQGLLNMASSVLKEAGIFVDLKKGIYSSDSIPFAKNGVPFINLARVKGRATVHIHTENDRGYYYRYEGLLKHFEASRKLIEFVGNADMLPFERSIDEDVKKELNEYIRERL